MLDVEGLAAGYGRVPVIQDISLKLRRGEAIAILGANGAGKSTMLRAISALLSRAAGTVRLAGDDVTGLSAERLVAAGLSHVAEGRRLFRKLSVEQNLELGLYALNPPAEMIAERREEAYELFPMLRQKAQQPAGSLSGGQQQMLCIAQALTRHPKVIMLDEPSLGLAPILVEEVFRTLEKVRRAGQAILLVEQVVERTLAFVDFAYVLQNGRIVSKGTPAELASADVVRRAYLGEAVAVVDHA
ncbi:MAG: branched-chain amino acid ABC transporter ATP-binding protein [Rhizobiales bacterium 65-9]|nr:ABC transporter ATP-binding protein [Hyphomicrobiales bacterium]OJY35704.1 MAG: branched-chain amino acid ABC transporter ATP-binding protein [Rhizobiales bacterium 65-9]